MRLVMITTCNSCNNYEQKISSPTMSECGVKLFRNVAHVQTVIMEIDVCADGEYRCRLEGTPSETITRLKLHEGVEMMCV